MSRFAVPTLPDELVCHVLGLLADDAVADEDRDALQELRLVSKATNADICHAGAMCWAHLKADAATLASWAAQLRHCFPKSARLLGLALWLDGADGPELGRGLLQRAVKLDIADRLAALRKLQLVGALWPGYAADVASACPGLTDLFLDHELGRGDARMNDMLPLTALAGLTSLTLIASCENEVELFDAGVVQSLGRLTGLRQLEAEVNTTLEQALGRLSQLTRLQSLRLRAFVEDDGAAGAARDYSALRGLSGITGFTVSNLGELHDAPAGLVHSLATSCRGLTTVRLQDVGIVAHADVLLLVSMPCLTDLEVGCLCPARPVEPPSAAAACAWERLCVHRMPSPREMLWLPLRPGLRLECKDWTWRMDREMAGWVGRAAAMMARLELDVKSLRLDWSGGACSPADVIAALAPLSGAIKGLVLRGGGCIVDRSAVQQLATTLPDIDTLYIGEGCHHCAAAAATTDDAPPPPQLPRGLSFLILLCDMSAALLRAYASMIAAGPCVVKMVKDRGVTSDDAELLTQELENRGKHEVLVVCVDPESVQ